jgi:hypothetical protein
MRIVPDKSECASAPSQRSDKRRGQSVAWLFPLPDFHHLNKDTRPSALQSLRQSDHSAVEILIQFIWFDLGKATGLE